MRLFVGIPLEGETHAALAKLLPELRRRLPSCRWVNPDNLHLTLRFLGEVPDDLLPEIQCWFQQGVAPTEFKSLKLVRTGLFKHRERLVFWCGVRAGNWLAELADRLAGPVANVPAEQRAFVPHLTLGRCRVFPDSQKELEEFQKYFSQLELQRAEQTNVRAVLYASELTPNGSVYRELMSMGPTPE